MEASEQPTAPYLDAVIAYAFRGPARYHVPGHKGGAYADPGLRKAIGVDGLAADVPQDIYGIDLGPSPTPYERAERLAAEAYGAARTFFLTNGATQGNHTLCLALAPLGTRIVAQRNSHASIVDGLVLSGGLPSFVAPEYDDELGITHCVTPEALERALRLLRSTSPSSLLIASLDAARRQLSLHGEQLLFETLEAIAVARAKLETIEGIALVDDSLVGRMGVAGYDPLRIVLDVRGTGRTGYEIADELRRSYDVHVELPMQATVVFIVGMGETVPALRRLAGDVEEVVKRIAEPGATIPIVPPAASLRNEVAVSPRDAFLGAAELVPVAAAVGRISCESIASYPPGV